MSWQVTCGEDCVSHPDVCGQVAVTLGELYGSPDSCRGSDYDEDQVCRAGYVVVRHEHNLALGGVERHNMDAFPSLA